MGFRARYLIYAFYKQKGSEHSYCYKKYLEAQSNLFCNERMCDASCDKYTFSDVKKAEEEARFDFECREEVLGAGNHICYDDDAQMKTSDDQGSGDFEERQFSASMANQISNIFLVFFLISFLRNLFCK